MPETDLLKPALYRDEGTTDDPARPALLGGSCSCGYVFFPMQTYGCERCGSTELSPRALSGLGSLLASARVHLHAGKGRVAPFTVGSIALKDGPIIRTLIIGADEALKPGARMASTLVDVTDSEGNARRDLRFVAES